MNRYFVNKEIKNSLRKILMRSYHEFTFRQDQEGNVICETPINEKNFNRLLKRAECEKKSKEDGVFYITAEEHNHMILATLLCDAANVKSYAVIDDPDFSKSIH